MVKLVAQELAKFHSMDIPIRKTIDPESDKWCVLSPREVDLFSGWVGNLRDHVAEGNIKPQEGFLELLNEISGELKWLKKFLDDFLQESKPEIAFCHNDFSCDNIIVPRDQSRGRIMLIDYEFSFYDYRSHDFATFFAQYDHHPSLAERTEFFRHYLGPNFDQNLARKLIFEADRFTVVHSMKRVTLLPLLSAGNPNNPVDFNILVRFRFLWGALIFTTLFCSRLIRGSYGQIT